MVYREDATVKLGPYELDQIYTGDARELAKAIPDESVDLIFTDPVYQNIDDYRWLAETAARVLKQNCACLTFHSVQFVAETYSALTEGGLNYRWQFAVVQGGGKSNRFMPKGFSNWYSCLWFEKGTSEPVDTISDALRSPSNWEYTHGGHEWRKNPESFTHWLRRFTEFGAIVFDPFMGGGTVPAVCKMLGRHYLAFEIDPDTAEWARQRVQNTQPPLLIPEPEQMTIEVMA